jgi:hypothetical protein
MLKQSMNTKLFLMAPAIVAAYSAVMITIPALAQNMTSGNVAGGNMTGGGNMTTAGNMTAAATGSSSGGGSSVTAGGEESGEEYEEDEDREEGDN